MFINNGSFANDPIHYTCSFDRSIYVDQSGVYEGNNWVSSGFTVKDGWVVLDKGGLKLKLTRSLHQYGILRGGEYKMGYQFSLENGKFIYVSLLIPLSRSWTITGSCKMD